MQQSFPLAAHLISKKMTQQMAEMGPSPEGCTISVIVGTSIGVRWDFSLGYFDDIFLKVIPPSCCYELSMPNISSWFKQCISPCIQNYWEIPGCRQMSTTWFMESKQFFIFFHHNHAFAYVSFFLHQQKNLYFFSSQITNPLFW